MNKYKILLSTINDSIKPLGFKKVGSKFFYKQYNNIGILDFQKSRDSSSEVILFTINIGVYSSSLHIFDNFVVGTKPTISDCHWSERIGFLLPEAKDHWWRISDAVPFHDLIKEITTVVMSIAIPEIRGHMSDKSLEEYWMRGISSGISEQQMLLYLIALLKAKNSASLKDKVEELERFSKGKPFQQNINECLLKLGISNK